MVQDLLKLRRSCGLFVFNTDDIDYVHGKKTLQTQLIPAVIIGSRRTAHTAKISFIQLLFREFHRTFGLQFLND